MENVVATYDYYTLDQARKIILEENKRKTKKKLVKFIYNIKMFFCLFSLMIIPPLIMILHWIVFGYGH